MRTDNGTNMQSQPELNQSKSAWKLTEPNEGMAGMPAKKAINKLSLAPMRRWKPPRDWVRITAIDAHTGGEPFRIFTGGFPELSGGTILERRRWVKAHHDRLRTALMWEPRGHADMYGCLVTPPVSPEADFGVLFMHNEGYSTMCGHGIIAITKVALETGLLPMSAPETVVRIDSPAGLITARARVSAGSVADVAFRNVPSFVLAQDETMEVPGLGRVRYDIAFGGAFYAYVRAADVGVTCTPQDFRPLIEKGMAIKRAIMAGRPISHPFEPDLGFLYGTILVGPPQAAGAHSRNVCVFAEGEVDRSPTGTGVSGRLALHHARGELGLNEPIAVESITGSRFTGRVVATTTFGPHSAVIPEVAGSAHICGRQEFLIDPSDPFRDGFILR
jgi:trans-L-3-hydroxyproline dehydratase